MSSYCTETNFIHALQTISEDLSIVGLPPVAKYNEKNPGLAIASLINSVWSLLQSRQRLIDSKRILEQKTSVLIQDLNYLKDKQKRTEQDLLHKEDCLIKEKRLLLSKDEDDRKALHQLKIIKQEVQELKDQLKGKENQFKHNLRRQNNEIVLLQTKLKRILSSEKGERWKGPIDNSVKHDLVEDQIKSKEDISQKCINRLENNIQTLVRENLELRKLLDSVSTELSDLLTKTKFEHNRKKSS